MQTRVATFNGDDYAIDENGFPKYKIVRYRIYSNEVLQNGDGTYSIPSIKKPRDCYWAYTRDTADLYMYDEEKQVWNLQ